MRIIAFAVAAFVVSGPAAAQSWVIRFAGFNSGFVGPRGGSSWFPTGACRYQRPRPRRSIEPRSRISRDSC
jgi:hypothetical protein